MSVTTTYQFVWNSGPIGPGFLLMLAPVRTHVEPVATGSYGGDVVTPPSRRPRIPVDLRRPMDRRKKVDEIAVALLLRLR